MIQLQRQGQTTDPPEGCRLIYAEYLKLRGKSRWIKDYDDESIIASLESCCSENHPCQWEGQCKRFYDRWNKSAPIEVNKYDWERLLQNKHGADPNWMPSFSFDGLTIQGQPEAKRWEFEPTRMNMMLLVTGIAAIGEET